MSPMFKKRKKPDENRGLRDLMEPPSGQSDRVVLNHIIEAIEDLQEHIEVPTLGAYQNFLEGELEWIKSEKEIRRMFKKLPL